MDSIEDVETPLEPVEYLARSRSRVSVLDAIDEEPRTRDELKELTEVSRFTLSRILADFEDRGWIVRSGTRYEATGKGSLVATEFETLLGNLAVAEELDGALEWLQTEQFGFDISCLRDAEVITPTQNDHTAHIRRAAEAVREADRVRSIATGVAHEMIEAIWESTVHGDLTLEGILGAETYEAIRADGELEDVLREVVEAERTEIFRYDGDATLVMMLLLDDAVLMCGHDEEGPAPGTIETESEEVRSWAASYLDSVRAEAHPVDAETFRS